MKVLVTGSNGLMGKSFQKIVKSKEDLNQYHFLTRHDCDLTDYKSVNAIFEKINPDVIIHFASGVGGVYENMNNNYNLFINNTRINTNIVDACNLYKVKKLVNILSTCIFPDKNVSYPLTFDQIHNGAPHESNYGYAYSKRVLHIGSQLLKESGCTVINFIPTNLYGENDNYNIKKAHVIPAIIHKVYNAIKNDTDLIINGSGNALRQFLYADDLSNIIYSKLDSTESNDYIISPPPSSEISIKELVNMIVKIFDFKGKVIYNSSDSDGQMKKTASSDLEYEFTNLYDGLISTMTYFVEKYDDLRI